MAYKILVVEDDTFLVGAYQAKFAKEGFEVQVATDGDEALEKLKSFTPDVILMDVVMPRKDGFTALQEIKDQEKLRDIPVIMATNLGQPEDAAKAKELGATGFVSKSNMSIGDLVSRVRTAAETKR